MRLIEPEVKGGLGVPLIVVTTQSSSHIPPEFERRVALRDDEVQRFTALHTEELYNGVLELGGVLVPAPVSRFLVQLNAKIQSTDQGLEYDRKKRYGAFLRESWTGNKVMDPTLTDKDEADIFVSVYAPFIDCITKLVAQAQKTWGYSILVEGLSFPAASVKRKRRNADIFLGTRDFTTASSYLITKTLETLAGLKYKTGVDNYGWNGGYPTGHFSRIANPEEMNPLGISPSKAEAIQIETNRGLYMNEGTFKKTGRFDSTKSDISKTLETISRHKPNL